MLKLSVNTTIEIRFQISQIGLPTMGVQTKHKLLLMMSIKLITKKLTVTFVRGIQNRDKERLI